MAEEVEVKVNLLNFDLEGMQSFFLNLNEKPYRAQQVMQWIHQRGCLDFAQMTNLSASLRAKLAEKAEISLPQIITCQVSQDGTRKWLIKLNCGNCIETVFIPEINRGTLCVSSQVGCALNCSFCATAKQGFNRNLTTAEIISQVWLAVRELSQLPSATLAADVHQRERAITNVVMMGMGEPLLNFDNVVTAMRIMMDDLAYGLSKRRVTLSTSGILPGLERLREVSPAAVAVSLHAPNDALRNELVPINKKYPLKELMAVCKTYFKDEPKRCITFEYVMLKDVNDQLSHARELVKLIKGVPAKVNLIPFNAFPCAPYQCSTPEAIEAFRALLKSHRINTTTRKTRGDDISAACGQLIGTVQDRTKRSAQNRS